MTLEKANFLKQNAKCASVKGGGEINISSLKLKTSIHEKKLLRKLENAYYQVGKNFAIHMSGKRLVRKWRIPALSIRGEKYLKKKTKPWT